MPLKLIHNQQEVTMDAPRMRMIDRTTTGIGNQKCCSSTHDAASKGHLHCLWMMYENGCSWSEKTLPVAAHYGHLECLRYVYEHGGIWNKTIPAHAAFGGHLDCLQYAHKNNCPWDSRTPWNAARRNHLECLQYAHKNGCPWEKSFMVQAALEGYQWCYSRDPLKCLQYVRDQGCSWQACYCTILFEGCTIFDFDSYREKVCKNCRGWLNARGATVPAILTSTTLPVDIAELIGTFACE